MKKWQLFIVCFALFLCTLRGEHPGFPNLTDTAVAGRGTNAAGLVSWWRLDGGIPNTAIDQGTNQATGTMVNGVTTDPAGQIRGCANMPGGTGVINIAKPGLNSIATSNVVGWTFSAWFKTTNAVAQDIYSEGNSTNTAGNQFIRFITSRSAAGDYSVSVRNDAGNNTLIATTGNTSTNGLWHMMTVTHPSGTNWIMYVDGAFKTTNSLAAMGTITMDQAAIGALRRNTTSTYFLGSIDDVRLYNRILELQEITNLYNKIAP